MPPNTQFSFTFSSGQRYLNWIIAFEAGHMCKYIIRDETHLIVICNPM